MLTLEIGLLVARGLLFSAWTLRLLSLLCEEMLSRLHLLAEPLSCVVPLGKAVLPVPYQAVFEELRPDQAGLRKVRGRVRHVGIIMTRA